MSERHGDRATGGPGRVLWPALLLLALLPPAVGALRGPWIRPATLWFVAKPGQGGARGEAVAELRLLPSEADVASGARRIVEELFLGPLDARDQQLAIPGRYLKGLYAGQGRIVADLSGDFVFGPRSADGVTSPPVVPAAVVVSLVRRTLRWNFPDKQVVVTVEGQEPRQGVAW